MMMDLSIKINSFQRVYGQILRTRRKKACKKLQIGFSTVIAIVRFEMLANKTQELKGFADNRNEVPSNDTSVLCVTMIYDLN